jgi:flagellar biosynthesis protein
MARRRFSERSPPLPRAKRPSAIALRYKPQQPFLDVAPKLVAKGQGYLAKRILELAKENNVPIHEDPDLTAVLEPLDVDSMIPPELFSAVATVLAALYRANGSGRQYD